MKNESVESLIVDSKITETKNLNLTAAGASVAKMIWTETFASGMEPNSAFKGFIAIGMASSDDAEYLKGAFEWSERHMPRWARERLSFSIDMDTDLTKVLSAFESIGIEGHRRLFGGGITACVPSPVRCTAFVGDPMLARTLGLVGGVYAWTEDVKSFQQTCHSFIGVDGVITNGEALMASDVEKTRPIAQSKNAYFTTPTLRAGEDYIVRAKGESRSAYGEIYFSDVLPEGVRMFNPSSRMMDWTFSIRNPEWVHEWERCSKIGSIKMIARWFETDIPDKEKKYAVHNNVDAKIENGALTFSLTGTIPNIRVRYARMLYKVRMQQRNL